MRIVHIDSSVICIEMDSGISVRMFPETASILCKQLNGVLSAIGHAECAPKAVELAATDSQQLKAEIAALIPALLPLATLDNRRLGIGQIIRKMRQLSAV
jgi:hypothetical protein